MRIVNSKVHLAASSSRQSLILYGRMTSMYIVTNQRHPRGDKCGIFLLFVGRDLVRISAFVKSLPIHVTKSHAHLTLRRLMLYIYIYIYIYGAPILDVSRSHTTTQHSR